MSRLGSSAARKFALPTPARRSGFTLVEVFIALALIGLLAATVLPQLHAEVSQTEDERLREQLHVLRGQIELYRVQHDDTLPGVTGPLLEQMTRRTDAAGRFAEDGAGDGPEHLFGPYLVGDAFPENPLTGATDVAIGETLPPADAADTVHGWRYSPVTGEFRAQGDEERAAW
ncbi:type II secretion system protein [Alienimonas chondri]|uniref:Prepilin-type N-terminal cleavage/methylation domain-containing protein n=1 Tax=Alienimonas chondri TaxID=2681879 RepID=A0ABX1VD83_9PLAN|nr:prepilin-type N-terminal cleavage/methylation domain-containing protein [Alienimonas chondri]NNJ26009.1 hypothetical protein [Alienimonas chondri]